MQHVVQRKGQAFPRALLRLARHVKSLPGSRKGLLIGHSVTARVDLRAGSRIRMDRSIGLGIVTNTGPLTITEKNNIAMIEVVLIDVLSIQTEQARLRCDGRSVQTMKSQDSKIAMDGRRIARDRRRIDSNRTARI
jgi:hypothetical protein